MGNKIPQGGPYTPKNNKTGSFFTPDKKNKGINAGKDSLFAEDKLFENFESKFFTNLSDTSIFGMRLDSDPEDREYYLNCVNCSKLNLDDGFNIIIM